MSLADKKCIPCRGGVSALTLDEAKRLLVELNDWTLVGDKRLQRAIELGNFAESLKLANQVGALAEEEGHHPDLLVRWGQLRIEIWTHKVNGLTESDFILASKIDRLLEQAPV